MWQAHRFLRSAAYQLGPVARWMAVVGFGLLFIRYGVELVPI